MKTQLLIIDPQEDFCNPQTGTLYVKGAEADMQRLAAFIVSHGSAIDAIHVTLDSHHVVDIAHPIWWCDREGNAPAPFTIITAADVATGVWRAARETDQERSVTYVNALAQNARYPLCIWPYHCLIGSTGHAVVPELFRALVAWEKTYKRSVNYIAKGTNPYTEHYSAIQADVIDLQDPQTLPNTGLVAALRAAERVYIAGEAGSHCVANTVRDLVRLLPQEHYTRLTILTDTLSPVTGFEDLQAAFLSDMDALGVRQATTVSANHSQ
jgi:nicotinamidase/pyrazinamidase